MALSPQQQETLDALRTTGSYRKAAKYLNIRLFAFQNRLKRIRRDHPTDVDAVLYDIRKPARQGHAPEFDITHEVPDGLTLRGTSIRYDTAGNIQQYWNKTKIEGRDPEEAVTLPDPKIISKISTLFDQEGRVTQQWVSERPDDQHREEMWRAAAEAFASKIPQESLRVDAPIVFAKELMAGYPIGDMHFGMYAWREEAGDDYDLKIAEDLLFHAFARLIEATPACQEALIAILGDFLHYDSMVPETPAHKNKLDADGRFAKMIQVVIRILRRVIALALARHNKVKIIVEPGNHDPFSCAFLTAALAALYEDTPRITVDHSPKLFHYHRFGTTLIGTHHGDKVKPRDLPLVMAADQAEAWGQTRYRYWWCGHTHQETVNESGGVKVENFRVLPPADAWAFGKGYRPLRNIVAIIYHEEYGEVARHIVNPAMLRSE